MAWIDSGEFVGSYSRAAVPSNTAVGSLPADQKVPFSLGDGLEARWQQS